MPKVGETATGNIAPQGNGHKFSLSKDGQPYTIKSVAPGEPWSNEHGTFTPYNCEFEAGGNGGSPERQNIIVRQHSQEMALRYAHIKGASPTLDDEFRKVIDWFDADAKGAK